MGDITLLKGDEHGDAHMEAFNDQISLYGNKGVIGRMADLHFAKSCYYPGEGWESEWNEYEHNVGKDVPNSNIFEAAQNDPLGIHPNDKRGISFCVIGRLS